MVRQPSASCRSKCWARHFARSDRRVTCPHPGSHNSKTPQHAPLDPLANHSGTSFITNRRDRSKNPDPFLREATKHERRPPSRSRSFHEQESSRTGLKAAADAARVKARASFMVMVYFLVSVSATGRREIERRETGRGDELHLKRRRARRELRA